MRKKYIQEGVRNISIEEGLRKKLIEEGVKKSSMEKGVRKKSMKEGVTLLNRMLKRGWTFKNMACLLRHNLIKSKITKTPGHLCFFSSVGAVFTREISLYFRVPQRTSPIPQKSIF